MGEKTVTGLEAKGQPSLDDLVEMYLSCFEPNSYTFLEYARMLDDETPGKKSLRRFIDSQFDGEAWLVLANDENASCHDDFVIPFMDNMDVVEITVPHSVIAKYLTGIWNRAKARYTAAQKG